MILRKQLEEQLPNLQLFLGNGEALTDYFAENSVSKVFLNFSDPWPKTKHEKRRLTYKSFLDIYKTILQPNKALNLKLIISHFTIIQFKVLIIMGCILILFQ